MAPNNHKIVLNMIPNHIESMKSLLLHFEEISYSQRQREMAGIGIAARTQESGKLVQILCEMAFSDDPYPRLTCIEGFRSYINYFKPEELSSNVLKAIHHLLHDNNRHIYLRAAPIAAKVFCSFDALSLTVQLPLPYVKLFCKALSMEKKESVLDACFKQESIMKDVRRRDAIAPYISEELLLHLSNEIFLSFSRKTYAKLVGRLPVTMLERIDRLIPSEAKTSNSTTALPVELLPVIYEAIKALAKSTTQSRKGLALLVLTLHRLDISESESNSCLLLYMALYPEEVSRYVIQQPSVWEKVTSIPMRVLRRLYKLPLDLQKQLVLDQEIISICHFSTFPVALREAVYRSAHDHLRDEVPNYFCYLTDSATRQKEGKRIVEDDTRETVSRVRGLRVFPFSVFNEPMGKGYVNDPDVEVRREAMVSMIHSANYYPETLPDILKHCIRHQNERDTFRSGMFEALNALKVSIWEESHLGSIQVLIQCLCAAKDLSRETANNAMCLLFEIAWNFSDFAAVQLSNVLACHPHAIPRRRIIPLESARKIWKVLSPIVKERMKSGQSCSIFSTFLDVFDHKIMKQLSDLLEDLLLQCMKTKNVVMYWKDQSLPVKWSSPQVLSMIPTLLRTHSESASCTGVKNIVACRIGGDSLLELLKPSTTSGDENVPKRMKKGKTTFIRFSPSTRFYCWTAQQQRTYSQTLLPVLLNNKNISEKKQLFSILSRLPSLTLEEHGIQVMIKPDYECACTRSLAMDLLGRMTDLGSLRELCVAAAEDGDGSRSKIAISPLIKRIRNLPFERAFPFLHPVLQSKAIGVQKEAVRLMGNFGCDPAFVALRQFEAEKGGNLHRDVKIAILESYYNFLWKSEVWEIYEHTVTSTSSSTTCDPALLPSIIGIPDDLLTMKWQREQFNHFMLTLLGHPHRSVVLSVLERLRRPQRHEDSRWYPVICQLIENAHKDSKIRDAASRTILALQVDPNELAESVSVFSSDEALKFFIETLSTSSRERGGEKYTNRGKVAHLLAQKLIAADRRLSLAARCIMMCSPSTWVELFQQLSNAGQLHSGVQFIALNTLANEMYNDKKQFIDELLEIEESILRHHKEEFFRRMGLGCILLSEVQRLYKSKFIQVLNIYRVDESKWVREDALSATCPDE